jgi:heat shock protein HtpX
MIPLFPLLLVVIGGARAIAWMRGRPNEWSRSPLLLVYDWASIGITFLAIAVTLLIRAHSRRREYAADDRAVTVTENPLALARALHKIQRATDHKHGMLSPLYVRGDETGRLTRLLSTHPPMDDRIERLLQQSNSSTRHIPIREGRR